MKSTLKRVVGAAAGLTALAFLGIFAKGIVTGIMKPDGSAEEGLSDADFADGDVEEI